MNTIKVISKNIYDVNFDGKDHQTNEYNPKLFPTSVKLKGIFEKRASKNNLAIAENIFFKNIKKLEAMPGFRWNHDMNLAGYHTAGHNRNNYKSTFGAFRYLNQFSFFIDYFNFSTNLENKHILDIGPWSGATCLLYEALGAKVDAIEEANYQTHIMNFLKKSFNCSFKIYAKSLYQFNEHNKYDILMNFGVLYHVTDPLVFLRICNNALKPGGVMLLETMSTNSCPDDSIIRYQGSEVPGGNWYCPNRIALSRMLYDAGFTNIKIAGSVNDNNYDRAFAIAERRGNDDAWEPYKGGWSKNIK